MIIAIDGPAASGKGTLGQAPRGAFRPAASRHRPPLPGRGPRPCSMPGQPLDGRGGRDRGRPALDAARPGGGSALRGARDGRGGLRGLGHPAGARRRCSRCSALRRPARAARCSTGATSARSICPDADVKLFVTAAPEERARRRHRELGKPRGGEPPTRRSWPISGAATSAIRPAAPPRSGRPPMPLTLDTTQLDASALSGGAPADRGERPLTPRESRRHVARIVRADQAPLSGCASRGARSVVANLFQAHAIALAFDREAARLSRIGLASGKENAMVPCVLRRLALRVALALTPAAPGPAGVGPD